MVKLRYLGQLSGVALAWLPSLGLAGDHHYGTIPVDPSCPVPVMPGEFPGDSFNYPWAPIEGGAPVTRLPGSESQAPPAATTPSTTETTPSTTPNADTSSDTATPNADIAVPPVPAGDMQFSNDFASAQETGGASEQQFTPNMFGDAFSAGTYFAGVATLTGADIGLFPNPAQGGAVGRTKVSDDNNPLPRERLIFNHDYFSNVPLTNENTDVNRFSVGFETLLFSERSSIELRVPFAITVNPDFTSGAHDQDAELGNIYLKTKHVLYQSSNLTTSGGVGIDLPTAQSATGRYDGTTEVTIENDSVALTPYMAFLWTPKPRLSAQCWVAWTFDTIGNRVVANTIGGPEVEIGRLQSQSMLQLDVQLAYELYSCDVNHLGLTRLTPFVELHYNTATSAGDVVVGDVNATTVAGAGTLYEYFDELNLTVGMESEFNGNLRVSMGLVAPLKAEEDRFFDYQLGMRANCLIGRSRQVRPEFGAQQFAPPPPAMMAGAMPLPMPGMAGPGMLGMAGPGMPGMPGPGMPGPGMAGPPPGMAGYPNMSMAGPFNPGAAMPGRPY